MEKIMIFDFDDTLVDSKQIHIDTYIQSFAEFFQEEINSSKLQYLRSKLNENISMGIEYVLKTYFYLNDDVIKEIRNVKKKHFTQQIKKIKIKSSTFELLKDHNFIISNATQENIYDIFDYNNIRHFELFRDIITPDLFYSIKRKPDAEMGDHLMKKYFLNPSDCVYVGDDKVDEMFAQNCGFGFIKV